MQRHFEILKSAQAERLPARVDEHSAVELTILKELVDAGLLSATDATSFDGPAYLNPAITLEGREYLRNLEAERSPSPSRKFRGLAQNNWVLASFIAIGGIIAWASGVVDGAKNLYESLVGSGPTQAERAVAIQTQVVVRNLIPVFVDERIDEKGRFDRVTASSLPSIRRLLELPESHTVFGPRTIGVIDRAVHNAEEYLAGEYRQVALASHFRDLTRRLVYFLARTEGDDRFSTCEEPSAYRTCDQDLVLFARKMFDEM
jgi:hypothetical protein